VVIKDYGQVSLWPEDVDVSKFWSLYNLEALNEISW